MEPFTVIKYTGKGHQGEADSHIHIAGGSIAGMETLCGNVDTFMPSVDVNEPVDCIACIEIYRRVRAMKGVKISRNPS